jgi:hypothetical protein
MSRDQPSKKRIVVEANAARHQRHPRAYSSRTKTSEKWVVISVIASAALATFLALFLTSRPYDPMDSTFDSQQAVPDGPLAMQPSPKSSPTPTPHTQNAPTPETADEGGQANPTDDGAIQAKIEGVFKSDAALADLDVSILVEGGNVKIFGSVGSADLKQRVERAVRTVKGVLAVDNQLVVLAASP